LLGIDIEEVVKNAPNDLKRREADITIQSFRPTQNDMITNKRGEDIIWIYSTQDYLNPLPALWHITI
jgi:hypothetical protein